MLIAVVNDAFKNALNVVANEMQESNIPLNKLKIYSSIGRWKRHVSSDSILVFPNGTF